MIFSLTQAETEPESVFQCFEWNLNQVFFCLHLRLALIDTFGGAMAELSAHDRVG